MSMRTMRQVALDGSAGAGTIFSEPFAPYSDSQRMAGQVKRLSGSGTLTVTLQGGWVSSDPATATDWVDLDLDTTAIASAQITEMKPTAGDNAIFATFPRYRLKCVVGSAAATGAAQILFF
mgnify:CR=1 FL=1